MKYVRQGDVVLRRVADRPAAGEVRAHTLAVGEESGHWHEAVGFLELEGGVRYLTNVEPTVLEVRGMPGRHDPITLPPGTWEVLIEQEYVPGAAPRRVAD